MTFSIPRRCCVVTIFATVVCMLSSPLLADLITARIALQTRQFELALAQAEDLAATHPFDSAMIAARAHVELRQFQDARTAATRAQRLAPKLAGPRILKALALHGLGQQVRGRMTQDVQSIRVFFGHDFQAGIAGDGVRRIDQLAVDLAGQGRFGQTGADRGGDIVNGRGGFERPLGAIRKRNGDHRFAG